MSQLSVFASGRLQYRSFVSRLGKFGNVLCSTAYNGSKENEDGDVERDDGDRLQQDLLIRSTATGKNDICFIYLSIYRTVAYKNL